MTVHVIAVDQLNAYDILVADEVVFTQSSLDTFVAGPVSGRSVKASTRASEAAGTDELAATSVEGSAEPRATPNLAASAASVAELLEPTDDVTDETSGASTPGAGSYVGDEPPAGFDIKGNADSMKFHTPESRDYGSTIAEVWFDSTAAAEAAGYTNAVREQNEEDAK